MFSTVLNFFSEAPKANVSDATICQINEQINKQKITRISKWNLDAGNIAVELDSSNCQGNGSLFQMAGSSSEMMSLRKKS